MGKPKTLPPPSYILHIPFPSFTLSWINSHICYAGGGGSAKTGVFNKIVLMGTTGPIESADPIEIDTQNQICASTCFGKNILIAGIDTQLTFFDTRKTPGTKIGNGEQCTGSINAISLSQDQSLLCIGCENGNIELWDIRNFSQRKRMCSIESAHAKAICAVSFSPDSQTVASSGKDGTARIWNVQTGKAAYVFQCAIHELNYDPKKDLEFNPKKKIPPILVRGCKYDSRGNLYTVASSKRGKAYLSKWHKGQELLRKPCSDVPISAMDISADHSFLTLGAVDGSVILLNTETLSVLKKFHEVHDLPVTAIAARPLAVAEDQEHIDVISVSADNRMAFLSRRVYFRTSSGITKSDIYWIVFIALMAFLCKHLFDECTHEIVHFHLSKSQECMVGALVASSDTPWVVVPPH